MLTVHLTRLIVTVIEVIGISTATCLGASTNNNWKSDR